jgi:hypothetical protein
VNKRNATKKIENTVEHSEVSPKPKRPRVSQRKELAVVTLGMVAAIASFGGLLTDNQAQASQPADNTATVAQVSSATPGTPPGHSSSKGQAPAYSPATHGTSGKASHAQSQGS